MAAGIGHTAGLGHRGHMCCPQVDATRQRPLWRTQAPPAGAAGRTACPPALLRPNLLPPNHTGQQAARAHEGFIPPAKPLAGGGGVLSCGETHQPGGLFWLLVTLSLGAAHKL